MEMYASIFKSWYSTDYILGYNTLKRERNNEKGIKMSQRRKKKKLKKKKPNA